MPVGSDICAAGSRGDLLLSCAGFRSLIIRQVPHRNSLTPLGHLTLLSHVAQLPVSMSLSSALDLPSLAIAGPPPCRKESVVEGYDFDSNSSPPVFFFFPTLNILSLLVYMWGFDLGEFDDPLGGEEAYEP